jgi:hypothetical protein
MSRVGELVRAQAGGRVGIELDCHPDVEAGATDAEVETSYAREQADGGEDWQLSGGQNARDLRWVAAARAQLPLYRVAARGGKRDAGTGYRLV